MPEIILTDDGTTLVVSEVVTEVVDATTPTILIEVAQQGVPGPRGLPGPVGPAWDQGGAFMVATRFSEIAADEAAKAQARANLDLQNIDGGTFN